MAGHFANEKSVSDCHVKFETKARKASMNALILVVLKRSVMLHHTARMSRHLQSVRHHARAGRALDSGILPALDSRLVSSLDSSTLDSRVSTLESRVSTLERNTSGIESIDGLLALPPSVLFIFVSSTCYSLTVD